MEYFEDYGIFRGFGFAVQRRNRVQDAVSGWALGNPLSSFINRGVFLNLSLQADETITIHGILVPVSWNTSGEIECVAVSTFDEKEYRIAGGDAARQWQDYLNREIAIQGRPFFNGIEQWITVQSFHVDQSAQDAGPNDI